MVTSRLEKQWQRTPVRLGRHTVGIYVLKGILGAFLCALYATSGLATVGDPIESFDTPGSRSTGLTFDGEYLWLADRKTAEVYQLDPGSGDTVRALPSPGFRPMGLAWDGRHLWNVDAGEQRLYAIDPGAEVTVKTLPCYTSDPGGLAWDGHYLWLADNENRLLRQLSPSDGTTMTKIPAPCSGCTGMAYDGRWLWVADRGADKLYRVDPETGDVTVVLNATGPYAWGLAWDGKNLWNADFQQDMIYQLALDDPEFLSRHDPKAKEFELTQEFRNYGPGVVRELDIYITIPGDLNSQEIIGDISFDPEPAGILEDRWGQPVAHFHYENLVGGQFVSPTMTVKARLYSNEYHIFPERVGSLDEIPREIAEMYLADGEKYQLDHPAIRKAVDEAIGDEKRPYWMARGISRHIVDRVTYKAEGGWDRAATVLERGTGSCSESAFVFIAMCRAAGLPARYAGAISSGGEDAGFDDEFHRWNELYLPGYGWIPWDVSGGRIVIGQLANRYLITTIGGGESEYMDYRYNFNTRWTSMSSGKCRIYSDGYGEWVPLAGD